MKIKQKKQCYKLLAGLVIYLIFLISYCNWFKLSKLSFATEGTLFSLVILVLTLARDIGIAS